MCLYLCNKLYQSLCNLFITVYYPPADWSACGILETEFWSVASLDFMILRPSVKRISWPFRNFSIWRRTPTTWCLSMHVCGASMSINEWHQDVKQHKHMPGEPDVSSCTNFPSRGYLILAHRIKSMSSEIKTSMCRRRTWCHHINHVVVGTWLLWLHRVLIFSKEHAEYTPLWHQCTWCCKIASCWFYLLNPVFH